MIDFSTVREITIPEGTVVKIANGSVLLWARPGLLPSTYQQVSYISTDGNQYIDTGVNASNYSNGIKYVFRGSVTKYQTTSTMYWFGALANGCRSGNLYTSSNSTIGVLVGGSGSYGFSSTTLRPAIGTDFELIAQGTPKDTNNFIVTINQQKISKNGTPVNSEMPNVNIYLFTASGTSASNTANMKYYGKLYGFTMDTVDGTPIRNFIPCYRKSDNVIGLYDTVGKQFYINAGTGNFAKGADVA